jgi:hypothetical protein
MLRLEKYQHPHIKHHRQQHKQELVRIGKRGWISIYQKRVLNSYHKLVARTTDLEAYSDEE